MIRRLRSWIRERRATLTEAGFANLRAVLEAGEEYEVAVQAGMHVGRGMIPAFIGVSQRRVVLYASYSPRSPRPYEIIDGMHVFPTASVQVTGDRFFGTDGWQFLALKTLEGRFLFRSADFGMKAVREALERPL